MSAWVSVAAVVIAVLAFGMIRERWRLAGLAKWCAPRAFLLRSPVVPGDRPPLAALASHFDVRGGRRWGAGVEGTADSVNVTFAEHETSPPGRKTGVWQTLVAWPVPEAAGPIVLWPGAGGGTADALAGMLGRSDARVHDRLGIPDTHPAGLRTATPGGLLIEAEPRVREAWLTEARRTALEAWPHGGAFTLAQGYAAWRVPGLLSVARVEELLRHLAEARRMLE